LMPLVVVLEYSLNDAIGVTLVRGHERKNLHVRRANSYLDVDDRTRITNSRLAVVGELLDKLGGQLAIEHANELEWIVIWLIGVEVLFELPHVPFGKLFSGIKSVGSFMGMA